MIDLKNDEKVIAITDSGKQLPYRLGTLKNDFLSKKLEKENIVISHIYSKRLNKSIKVLYSPNTGWKYKELN